MKVRIGSKNPVKIRAVKEVFSTCKIFFGAEYVSVEVSTEVSEQPKNLDELIRGAMNRARNAFVECDYSIGMESGLMQDPHTNTGYMDVGACAIYDGKQFHIGLSSAWEPPRESIAKMFKDGKNMSQVAFEIGLTNNSSIGSAEGLIGVVTKGRITRLEYTKQSVINALIHLENPEHY